MILLCGLPTDRPLALVAAELHRRRAPFAVLNQRELARFSGDLEIRNGALAGRLQLHGINRSLADIIGIYTRPTDDASLSKPLERNRPTMPMRSGATRQEWFSLWWNLTPARVVNRPAALLCNCSRPWQLQIIRNAGFSIPATLITSDADALRAFRDQHERVIPGFIHAARFNPPTLPAAVGSSVPLRARAVPGQFHEVVPGQNVRVHVVGHQCFATAITADSTDDPDSTAGLSDTVEYHAIALPPDIAIKCVALTRQLGLALSELDLRVTPNGRVVCLQAKAQPDFSNCQRQAGQPIASAIADYLLQDVDTGLRSPDDDPTPRPRLARSGGVFNRAPFRRPSKPRPRSKSLNSRT